MSAVLNPDPPGRVPAVSGRNRIIGKNVKVTLVHPEKVPREHPQEEDDQDAGEEK